MPRHCPRSISPSPSVWCLPLGLCNHLPQLTSHQFLRHLRNQRKYLTWLIAAYGPNRRVSFVLAHPPNVVNIATLQDYILATHANVICTTTLSACTYICEVILLLEFWAEGSYHLSRRNTFGRVILTCRCMVTRSSIAP
jgi:hypothetical protein